MPPAAAEPADHHADLPGDRPGERMALRVNGEQRRCRRGLTLPEVLEELGYRPELVVVEFNGEILPRRCWSLQMVQESDVLEVVTIVGGGS
ncbi:MAG: sulfur carrier protein ThiS [Prochlorococcaceae cyanobacterium]